MRGTLAFSAAVALLALSLIGSVLLYSFAHRYRYDHTGHYLTRTDTWTGRSEALSPRLGWRRLPLDGPAAH